MNYNQRKRLRFHQWDYTRPASYFVTFCTAERAPLLGSVLEAPDVFSDAVVRYSRTGELCREVIGQMATEGLAQFESHVIMPNHVHLLVSIERSELEGKGVSISGLVGKIKGRVSFLAHREGISGKIWQRSFHDHIVRNQSDYDRICEYIANNPKKWTLDRYYIP